MKFIFWLILMITENLLGLIYFLFERWFNDLLFTKNSRNMYWRFGWGSRVNTTKRMRHTYLLLLDLKYSLNLFFVIDLIEAFQISTICLPLIQLIHGFYFLKNKRGFFLWWFKSHLKLIDYGKRKTCFIFSNDLKNSVNFFFKISLIVAFQSFNKSFIINTIKVCV